MIVKVKIGLCSSSQGHSMIIKVTIGSEVILKVII